MHCMTVFGYWAPPVLQAALLAHAPFQEASQGRQSTPTQDRTGDLPRVGRMS